MSVDRFELKPRRIPFIFGSGLLISAIASSCGGNEAQVDKSPTLGGITGSATPEASALPTESPSSIAIAEPTLAPKLVLTFEELDLKRLAMHQSIERAVAPYSIATNVNLNLLSYESFFLENKPANADGVINGYGLMAQDLLNIYCQNPGDANLPVAINAQRDFLTEFIRNQEEYGLLGGHNVLDELDPHFFRIPSDCPESALTALSWEK